MTWAPYVVSADNSIDEALKLAKPKSGELIYDLGCGDCRILIQSAKKYGTKGLGYDISPFCYLKSKFKIGINHLAKTVDIKHESLFSANLSQPDIIFLYTGTQLMDSLEDKIFSQMKPTARVVSLAFSFKDHKPIETKIVRQLGKETQVFLYKK